MLQVGRSTYLALEPLSKANVYFAMSVVCRALEALTMSQDYFILDAQDIILDAKTRKIVAIIRNGEVFRDDDGARIAVFVGSNLYDLLDGNFLGRLDGCTRYLPIALRKLLEGTTAVFSPYLLSLPRLARRLP
jgi:hypothetical protein